MMWVSTICSSGQADQQHQRHQAQLPALGLQEGRLVGGAQPVDERPHEAEQRDFTGRNRGAQDRHGDEPALGALAIMQAEGDQPLGRLRRLPLRIGVQPILRTT
jgi:hypothetical protein